MYEVSERFEQLVGEIETAALSSDPDQFFASMAQLAEYLHHDGMGWSDVARLEMVMSYAHCALNHAAKIHEMEAKLLGATPYPPLNIAGNEDAWVNDQVELYY